MDQEPDFLIIGAMRSGTTSLHHWLRGHPQVAVSRPKEVHYFDVNYPRGPQWYARHFGHASPGQLLGESTPEYLFLPWARQRMCADLPQARMIVTLRNPVDRAWSHYCMLKERGKETLGFEAALEAESQRLEDPDLWSRYGYLTKGLYAAQLRDLFERHERDRVLVLFFERDLAAQPAATFRRICDFLRISPEVFVPSVGATVNAAMKVRSVRLRGMAQHLPKRARDAVGRINSTASSKPWKLNEVTRWALTAHFAEANRDLEDLLGRAVPEWTGIADAPDGPGPGR